MPDALTTNENICEGLKAACCRKVAIRCQRTDYCAPPHVAWWPDRFGRDPARPRAPVSRVPGKIGSRIVPHHDLARRRIALAVVSGGSDVSRCHADRFRRQTARSQAKVASAPGRGGRVIIGSTPFPAFMPILSIEPESTKCRQAQSWSRATARPIVAISRPGILPVAASISAISLGVRALRQVRADPCRLGR
jgi:hypothetical protein